MLFERQKKDKVAFAPVIFIFTVSTSDCTPCALKAPIVDGVIFFHVYF